MKRLKLQRISYRPDCVLGVLYDSENDAMFATIERPDLGNNPEISCIPEGEYICSPYSSFKFKDVWELQNVPGRKKILIHSANRAAELRGCLALGRTHGKLSGVPAVISSKIAIAGLRKHVGAGNEFVLVIERI